MAGNSKKAVDDLSRRARRGPPGPSPLLVIAGLPQATALPAAATINNDRDSRWRAVARAFARNDAGIYGDGAAIVELGRQACQFALERRRDREGVPTPSRIVLAYVAEQGFERLWDVFGHAVLPIPLDHPDWDWSKGRHWRHEIETVNLLLRRALHEAENGAAEALRLRLEARRSDDILLLPGRNFHLGPEDRLVDRFRNFMSNRLDVVGVEAGIRVERFSYTRLKPFYGRVGGRGKCFAIDSRNIVFAKSNNGQHGGQHEIPRGADMTAPLLQRTLEGRYRFGTPLEPEGFQHDVQREMGAVFNNEWFYCVIRGPRQFSGDHVNVFPSDVVTGDV
jgi:hypothetical protein